MDPQHSWTSIVEGLIDLVEDTHRTQRLLENLIEVGLRLQRRGLHHPHPDPNPLELDTVDDGVGGVLGGDGHDLRSLDEARIVNERQIQPVPIETVRHVVVELLSGVGHRVLQQTPLVPIDNITTATTS